MLSAIGSTRDALTPSRNIATLRLMRPSFLCSTLVAATCFLSSAYGFERVAASRTPELSASADKHSPAIKPRSRRHYEHNVAIIVDSGAWMNNTDRNCSNSHIACALAAVRLMLGRLSPCIDSASCTTSDRAATRVSLFTFPNVEVDSAVYDYICDAEHHPKVLSYTFPVPGAPAYAPREVPNRPGWFATYRIVDFTNDYRLSNDAQELNPDSYLVKAVGGRSGCPSMWAIGGVSSYSAGAIYAAQASLIAEQRARPGSTNVIVLVSDGWSNSTAKQLSNQVVDPGAYGSAEDECGQAIEAATTARTAGTTVYSVAYDSSTRPCPTEQSGPYKGISGCQTMKAIASSPQYFFSAPSIPSSPSVSRLGPSAAPCVSPLHKNPDLNDIFTRIAQSIETLRPSRKPSPVVRSQ